MLNLFDVLLMKMAGGGSGGGGSGGGGNDFIITAQETDNGFVFDKTWDEIEAAVFQRKIVYLAVGYELLLAQAIDVSGDSLDSIGFIQYDYRPLSANTPKYTIYRYILSEAYGEIDAYFEEKTILITIT